MPLDRLDALGLELGTDKASIGNDYLGHYARNLKHLEKRTFNLLEIGIAQGASLKMWRAYFPNAHIVGVDINEECQRFADSEVTVEIGSQDDPEFLTALGIKYEPLVIIDDGSHLAKHNMSSFQALFPCLPPSGIYIIEDLYLHHPESSNHARGATVLPARYFAELAFDLTTESPMGDGRRTDAIIDTIARIEFFRRAVLIEKKDVVDYAWLAKAVWPLLERAGSAYLWHMLSTFILRHRLPLEDAARATRHGLQLDPNNPDQLHRLADITERQGLTKEALGYARAALGCAPNHEGLARLVRRLEQAAAQQ